MAMHAIGIIVTTVVGPKLVSRFGPRSVLIAGLFGSGFMTFAFALTGQDTSLVLIGTILLVSRRVIRSDYCAAANGAVPWDE